MPDVCLVALLLTNRAQAGTKMSCSVSGGAAGETLDVNRDVFTTSGFHRVNITSCCSRDQGQAARISPQSFNRERLLPRARHSRNLVWMLWLAPASSISPQWF